MEKSKVKSKPTMGRPPLPEEEVLVHLTIRVKKRQKAKVQAAIPEWLRDAIDATPIPAHQLKKPPEGGS